MSIRTPNSLLLSAACWLFCLSTSGHAAPVRVGHVAIELVSEVQSIQPGQPIWVAVRFQVDPGWHINWRNPGDAGLPPTLAWELPAGFSAGEIQWPMPERLVVDPLTSYGYEGTVLLPVSITAPPDVSGTVTLRASVDWLVCKGSCIPGAAEVELSLPVTNAAPAPDRRWDEEFADTRFHLPLPTSEWVIEAHLTSEAIELTLNPPPGWEGDPGETFFLPYASDLISNHALQPVEHRGDRYFLSVERARNNPKAPEGIKGILVSSRGWRGADSEQSLEVNVKIGERQAVAAASAGAKGASSVWRPLLFAFLGGLILNLMPCVLPVLSIKVLSLVQQAGRSRTSALGHGLLYAFGVLVSFWILAGLLLALRSAGQELGWGFQLQSPAFVMMVAGVFFLLGLSLFGVFEIGTSLMGLGAKAGSRGGALGAFNSGILAVVVATPCTAPFMGSALGYALSQPAALSLLVFTALGLGLALPYVLFTSSPVLLRHVPKPGAWMETLKQLMGFLLMATVVWLAWVLGNQRGPQVVAVLLSMLLALAVAAWIWGRWGNVARSTQSRLWAFFCSALLVVASVAGGLKGADLFAISSPGAATANTEWVPYNELELARLVSGGTPVLVDFTADWCLSCKVNEQVALGAESVQEQVRKQGVVLMRADWTLRNVEISRALAKFGRSSVPLYVLYPGGRLEQHVTLPEILTPGIVLEALKQLNQQDAT